MSGFVFLRARGLPEDDGGLFFVFFFPPQLGEKMRQRRCRRRAKVEAEAGGETRAGTASRACGRRTRLGARGAARERLWSSGVSAMEAEPRRGCCTDPPPTPRSGPAHLAVSRLSIGASRRDALGGRANRKRRVGGGAWPRSLVPPRTPPFFLLSNKISRREAGERPASGDAAARAGTRAPGGGRRRAGLRSGARLCARRGHGAQRASHRGRMLLLLPGSRFAFLAT